jgi:hypothetical protein
MGAQAVDPPDLCSGGDAAPGAFGGPERTAWTAYGLHASELPPVDAELFIEAGAIVAERAARGAASRGEVEAILRRASEQAGRLLRGA